MAIRKSLTVFMAVLLVLPLLLVNGPQVQAASGTAADSPAQALIDWTREHLEDLAASGDIGHPLAQQLRNRLNQANHHLEQGRLQQAVKTMEDFLNHLDNKGMQKFVTEAAKQQMESDANHILRILGARSQEAAAVVAGGEAQAVVIIPPGSITNKTAPNWPLWTHGGGSAERSEDVARSGFASLLINDMPRGGVSQIIDVQPGPVSMQLYFYTPAGTDKGSIQIGMNLRAADNTNVRTILSSVVPFAPTAGEWGVVTMQNTIPESVNGKAVVRAQVVITVDSGQGIPVYVDDYLVYQDDENVNLLKNPGFEDIAGGTGGGLLTEYVQKSTGVQLPLATSVQPGYDGVSIYVGQSREQDREMHQALLNGLNDHGFIIDVQEDAITILGKTPRATDFGISEFLERFVGVRWLMPGPDGEHVPQHDSLAVPLGLVRDEPAAISRQFSGLNGSVALEWASRNRMQATIAFHHNMTQLFDPNVFADHPEYYAGGVVPTHPYSWQPCFNDVTAAAAIQRIIEYFDNNPGAISYSVGINDGTQYCEGPGHPDYPTQTNSIGKLHRSDLYFRWVNTIAEGVAQVYPDKYIGLLAYREMYDIPRNPDGSPMPLHPNVVPYITDDRMTWADPHFEAQGKQTTQSWKQVAQNLGFYDYMYGAQYNVPRIYLHQMAENYKYANENGVIGHYAELYVNWGEGPKPWVALKLQWNPHQDVDALLDDWYKAAVGEAAAPYLKQYYDYWEQIWTSERIFNSSWFDSWKSLRNNYLPFNSTEYLRVITKEDMAISRQLLEQAVAHAASGTEAQLKRAQLLLKAFEFYEASVLSFPRTEPIDPPATEAEAIQLLDDIRISLDMAQKRKDLMTEFAGHPVLDLRNLPNGVWNGVQRIMFDALAAYVEAEPEGGPVGALVDQFLSELPENIRQQFTDDFPDLNNLYAEAKKTTAGKETILQTLDFSQGPWAEATPFDEFLYMNTTTLAPVKTNVRLLWDDEYLYVGYENFDDDLSQMVLSDDAPNNWWRSGGDDSVETYVTGDPETYTGFFTNPNEVKFVYNKNPGVGPAPGPDPGGWEVSAAILSDRWNVIQAIPFSLIGVDPNETQQLHGFFFRNYHGKTAYLGWGGGNPWNSASFRPVYLLP